MPNWCENVLKVSPKNPQDDNHINQFIKFKNTCVTNKNLNNRYGHIARYHFDFNQIIPMPKSLKESSKENEEKYGHTDWYGWCNENWGTKWNSSDTAYVEQNNTAKIYFNTAWSPPIPIIDKLINKYPLLNFELGFIELGMCFAGIYGNEKQAMYELKSPSESEDNKNAVNGEDMLEENVFKMLGF